MAKVNDLVKFYQEHIKSVIISLEKSVSFALGDYKGQQMQVSYLPA